MMSLEKAGTSSSWNVPVWMERFYQDNNFEVADDTPERIILLPWEARNVVWSITKHFFGIEAYGVAGQACMLMERYLANRLRSLDIVSARLDWQKLKLELCSKMQMLVAVSVQLASKMCSGHNHITNQDLQTGLIKFDRLYSLREINGAEADIYSCLSFHIPVWTNVDKALVLAEEVGLSDLLQTVALIMDIVDYSRLTLQENVQSIAFAKCSTSTSLSNGGRPESQCNGLAVANVRCMHLAAGTVAATKRFMHCKGADPVPRLAFYTRCPPSYISCICNVILNCIINMRDNDTNPAKVNLPTRKRHRPC